MWTQFSFVHFVDIWLVGLNNAMQEGKEKVEKL